MPVFLIIIVRVCEHLHIRAPELLFISHLLDRSIAGPRRHQCGVSCLLPDEAVDIAALGRRQLGYFSGRNLKHLYSHSTYISTAYRMMGRFMTGPPSSLVLHHTVSTFSVLGRVQAGMESLS